MLGNGHTALLVAMTASLLGGCAPKNDLLAKAGYYEPRERQIRLECEKQVYADGRQIGPYFVRNERERFDAVEKIIKARPGALIANQAGLKIDFGAAEGQVAAIDQELKACEQAKGSTVAERYAAEFEKR